jgi:DNA-binding IscR family transcriptional regulator
MTSHGACDIATTCSVREPLRRVNDSILDVLAKVTISQMSEETHMSEMVELRV